MRIIRTCFLLLSLCANPAFAERVIARVFVDDTLYQYPNIRKYVELSGGTSEKYMKFAVQNGILPDLSVLVTNLKSNDIGFAENYYYDQEGKQKDARLYSGSDDIYLSSGAQESYLTSEEKCLAHEDSAVSQSGNLCLIFGIGENDCKNAASQDGGVYWQHWRANIDVLDFTGMEITEDTCLYILGSVYKRMSAVCASLGGTPDGEYCENINLSLVPSNQTCKEYLSGIYTEWPLGGVSTDTESGNLTKCSFSFLSRIPDAANQTYVADELRGECFYPGMNILNGRCRCPNGYGVDLRHTSEEINEIGCELCDPSASEYFSYGCGN